MTNDTRFPVRRVYETEHEDFRASFRRFLDTRVVPDYAKWEAEGCFPEKCSPRPDLTDSWEWPSMRSTAEEESTTSGSTR